MITDSRNSNKIAKLVFDVLTTKSRLAERGNLKGRFAMIKWGLNKLNHIYVDDQQIVAAVYRVDETPVCWRVSMGDLERNEAPLLSATNSLLLAGAKAILDSVVTESDEIFLMAELEALVASEPA